MNFDTGMERGECETEETQEEKRALINNITFGLRNPRISEREWKEDSRGSPIIVNSRLGRESMKQKVVSLEMKKRKEHKERYWYVGKEEERD